MVLDTSVLFAILQQEPDAAGWSAAIAGESKCLISAASVVEAGVVMVTRYGERGGAELDRLLLASGAEIVPVTAAHARIARDAFVRYGKGRHPARLNFGDCFTYALACASGHPLLFKGDDFSQTDVVVAPASRA
jgi:ribonuclease VapC